jgi:hypothetical protein
MRKYKRYFVKIVSIVKKAALLPSTVSTAMPRSLEDVRVDDEVMWLRKRLQMSTEEELAEQSALKEAAENRGNDRAPGLGVGDTGGNDNNGGTAEDMDVDPVVEAVDNGNVGIGVTLMHANEGKMHANEGDGVQPGGDVANDHSICGRFVNGNDRDDDRNAGNNGSTLVFPDGTTIEDYPDAHIPDLEDPEDPDVDEDEDVVIEMTANEIRAC